MEIGIVIYLCTRSSTALCLDIRAVRFCNDKVHETADTFINSSFGIKLINFVEAAVVSWAVANFPFECFKQTSVRQSAAFAVVSQSMRKDRNVLLAYAYVRHSRRSRSRKRHNLFPSKAATREAWDCLRFRHTFRGKVCERSNLE